eukprot:1638518-Prymnesium_polylepis.1
MSRTECPRQGAEAIGAKTRRPEPGRDPHTPVFRVSHHKVRTLFTETREINLALRPAARPARPNRPAQIGTRGCPQQDHL